MTTVKLTFVGAGSYVFGPSVLSQALKENRIEGIELALVDKNRAAAERMAAIGRVLAEREGVRATITAHDDWNEALPGSDFVVSCAAVEMNRRFFMDKAILDQEYPEHLITEFGGVQGISSTLRQIALVRELARSMQRHCPDAWLLDIANPLPRVCQAAHEEGVRTVGFCSVSISGYDRLGRLLDGQGDRFPYTRTQNLFGVKMGGTNHLSWLVELRDRSTGEDLYPRLREIASGLAKPSKCELYLQRTGYLLMSGDDHVQDFLPIDGLEHSLELTSHGSDEDREARESVLDRAARGEEPFESVEKMVSWERPLDLVAARVRGERREFSSLNLVNEGQVSGLPQGIFVETRVVAEGAQLQPERLDLPEEVLPFSRNAVEVSQAILQGSREKNRSLLEEALVLDPTVTDFPKAKRALDRCLEAHQDLIGTFR